MKLIWTLTLLLTYNIGFSCTCKSLGNIDKNQFNQYDLIATGKILSVDFEEFEQKIKVGIHRVFKGNINKMTIVLSTSRQSGMCGIFPKVGEKWLVYANGNGYKFSTNLCTRTQNMSSANQKDKGILKDDLRFLNEHSTRD